MQGGCVFSLFGWTLQILSSHLGEPCPYIYMRVCVWGWVGLGCVCVLGVGVRACGWGSPGTMSIHGKVGVERSGCDPPVFKFIRSSKPLDLLASNLKVLECNNFLFPISIQQLSAIKIGVKNMGSVTFRGGGCVCLVSHLG